MEGWSLAGSGERSVVFFKPLSRDSVGAGAHYQLKETDAAWTNTIRLVLVPLPVLGVNDPQNLWIRQQEE